jgi:hypothetical protein
MAIEIKPAVILGGLHLPGIEIPRIPDEQGMDLRIRVEEAFQRAVVLMNQRGRRIQNSDLLEEVLVPESPVFVALGPPL